MEERMLLGGGFTKHRVLRADEKQRIDFEPEKIPASKKRPAKASRSHYFFLPDPSVGCHPAAELFWLGAAAIVLIFSFLGFFFSRLLLSSPLAMSTSFG